MTKVSGLAAAASLLDTHEFGANEAGVSKKVTGLQFKNAGARGLMAGGLAELIAASATFTNAAAVDLLTLGAITIPTGRRMKLSVVGVLTGTVNSDLATLTLQEGAAVLQTILCGLQPTYGYQFFCFHVYLLPTAAAHTYKLVGIRGNGTGTMNVIASATQRCQLTLEDVGT